MSDEPIPRAPVTAPPSESDAAAPPPRSAGASPPSAGTPPAGPTDVERARASRMTALGLAAMTVGVAAAVCRYLFLPLELGGGHWNAVLVGGAAGLLGAGFQQFRMGRKRGGRLPGRQLALFGLLPPVAVVALFAVVAPLLDPLDDELAEREFPGLAVPLPDWDVLENSSNGAIGTARLRVPYTANGYLEVRRFLGPLPTPDETARLMQAAGPLAVGEGVAAVADGRPARIELLSKAGDGRWAALASFECPGSGLSVMIWLLAGDAERDELVGFLRRVLAGARCLPLPAGTAPGSQFPLVDPPEGYQAVEHAVMKVWEGPLGDFVAFSPGVPDPDVPTLLRRRPGMVAEVMRAELSLVSVEADPAPLPMPGGTGALRDIWSGRGMFEDGTPLRFLLTVWSCPGGLTYYGYYVAPPDAPREAGLGALRTAACP
ncbi:MAG: hypothetical protein JXB32_00755 [Deltaproteobacteria bacterium]|nr:hypothetical protein [Deltaproteobacteria bacterium]